MKETKMPFSCIWINVDVAQELCDEGHLELGGTSDEDEEIEENQW